MMTQQNLKGMAVNVMEMKSKKDYPDHEDILTLAVELATILGTRCGPSPYPETNHQ